MTAVLVLVRRLLGSRCPGLPGYVGPHLRRDIGMDDWEGSIGSAWPDHLWSSDGAQDRRASRTDRVESRLAPSVR